MGATIEIECARYTQADLARYQREFRLNGYCVFEAFLPVSFVQALHQELLPILLEQYERYKRGDTTLARGPNRLAFDVSRHARSPDSAVANRAYRQNPVIEEFIGLALGTSRWRRGWSQVECVWSGSEPMGWHSDQTIQETPHPQRPNRTVRSTYNIPLVDFTADNGAMEVVPGSHLLPRTFLAQRFDDLPKLRREPLYLRQGDVLVRDGNMLHRGTPNRTAQPRPMLDQTYHREIFTREVRRWLSRAKAAAARAWRSTSERG